MKTFRELAFIWFALLCSISLILGKPILACAFSLLMISIQLDQISAILKERQAA